MAKHFVTSYLHKIMFPSLQYKKNEYSGSLKNMKNTLEEVDCLQKNGSTDIFIHNTDFENDEMRCIYDEGCSAWAVAYSHLPKRLKRIQQYHILNNMKIFHFLSQRYDVSQKVDEDTGDVGFRTKKEHMDEFSKKMVSAAFDINNFTSFGKKDVGQMIEEKINKGEIDNFLLTLYVDILVYAVYNIMSSDVFKIPKNTDWVVSSIDMKDLLGILDLLLSKINKRRKLIKTSYAIYNKEGHEVYKKQNLGNMNLNMTYIAVQSEQILLALGMRADEDLPTDIYLYNKKKILMELDELYKDKTILEIHDHEDDEDEGDEDDEDDEDIVEEEKYDEEQPKKNKKGNKKPVRKPVRRILSSLERVNRIPENVNQENVENPEETTWRNYRDKYTQQLNLAPSDSESGSESGSGSEVD